MRTNLREMEGRDVDLPVNNNWRDGVPAERAFLIRLEEAVTLVA